MKATKFLVSEIISSSNRLTRQFSTKTPGLTISISTTDKLSNYRVGGSILTAPDDFDIAVLSQPRIKTEKLLKKTQSTLISLRAEISNFTSETSNNSPEKLEEISNDLKLIQASLKYEGEIQKQILDTIFENFSPKKVIGEIKKLDLNDEEKSKESKNSGTSKNNSKLNFRNIAEYSLVTIITGAFLWSNYQTWALLKEAEKLFDPNVEIDTNRLLGIKPSQTPRMEENQKDQDLSR